MDAYSVAGSAASAALERQSQMRRRGAQAAARDTAFRSRWPTRATGPMSVGAPEHGFRRYRGAGSAWLTDALRALSEVDDEIIEDGLPEISPSAKREAERIIRGLARHPWAPTVYPTEDAEIAIHFKSPDLPNSVVILLDSHGHGECYAYTGGRSRRAHYDVSSDLPDGFVMEQLRALTPGRTAPPPTWQGLGASAMDLLGGFPTAPTM